MKYLVVASHGPGFASDETVVEVLKNLIMPTFEALIKLEAKGLVSDGLPVAERTFTFILNAASNDEADAILRSIPAWGVLDWKVTPLQTFKNRRKEERIYLSLSNKHRQ